MRFLPVFACFVLIALVLTEPARASSWGSAGSRPGQFMSPTGIAVDSQGRVLVMDTNNSRVQRFTAAGAFLDAWGSSGGGPGQFNRAEFLAVGPGDTVFVADYHNDRVQVFGPD